MKEVRLVGSITYPLWVFLIRVIPPIIVFILLQIYSPKGISSGEIIASFIALVLSYLFGQYRYSKINIYRNYLEQVYVGSLYLKNKHYHFAEIELAFFKFQTGRMSDPVVILYLKNGKKKKIFMPKQELEWIRHELKDLGVTIRNSKDGFDKP